MDRKEWHPHLGQPRPPIYTVTVYVAAPGTPIRGADGQTTPSTPGHMYYSISDGESKDGYGFSPIRHGQMSDPGRVVRDEFGDYQNPLYARTLEITKDQYQKLKEYGEAGVDSQETHFDLYYNGASNSCVDFVWTGLNHAGIHKSQTPLFGKPGPETDYEGSFKPTRNIDDIQSVPPPIPGSRHNSEQRHPMPERSLMHRLFSEEPARDAATPVAMREAQLRPDQPGHPDHAAFETIRKAVRSDGRWDDEQSNNIAADLLRAHKADPLSKRLDSVAIGGVTEKGEVNVFAVSSPWGEKGPHFHVQVDAMKSAQVPAEQNLQQAEQFNQQRALQADAPDAPTRGGQRLA